MTRCACPPTSPALRSGLPFAPYWCPVCRVHVGEPLRDMGEDLTTDRKEAA